jgi:hypothetical protein
MCIVRRHELFYCGRAGWERGIHLLVNSGMFMQQRKNCCPENELLLSRSSHPNKETLHVRSCSGTTSPHLPMLRVTAPRSVACGCGTYGCCRVWGYSAVLSVCELGVSHGRIAYIFMVGSQLSQKSPCSSWLNQLIFDPECRSDTFLRNVRYTVRFEVFTAVTMKNGVFWVVTPRRNFFAACVGC